MKHQSPQRGFTLIEAMIVVAILGILAAVALPTYMSYTIRARTTEVVLAASTCRTAITEVLQNATQVDASASLLGSCSVVPTKYVKSGSSDKNGAITIVADETKLGGDTSASANAIELKPYITTGSGSAATTTALDGTKDGGKTITEWRCGPASNNPMPKKYLPGSCQGS